MNPFELKIGGQGTVTPPEQKNAGLTDTCGCPVVQVRANEWRITHEASCPVMRSMSE